ncbi:GMC oxidoreductase [Propionibacterium australiense]|uniref:GMC family oxidoreductase n=1 Tax=Propionibacterium australiense TaxID=119981 RepID=A0A8B3GF93_9ACTN|nr:GMC family oxidoreductase [Propionibacterium australiense]RLP09588.1 GMC family oxidoreductase [Propionibacterium australiense]
MSTERRFDAIVVGSGMSGGIAVKVLTERGMEVLLLEAGKEFPKEDFIPDPPGEPKDFGMDILPRAQDMLLKGQWYQARRAFFDPSVSKFMVNDLSDPYIYKLGHPYIWFRSKMIGGRMQTYGRVLQRMSDLDFKAASLDGYGEDWPFSYSDLEPYYDSVEEFVGVYGDRDGLEAPADGRYVGPGFLSAVERELKAKVEERWPERKVISWRVQAPFADRIPPGVAAARRTGRLTERTNAQVTKVTVNVRTGLANGVEFVDRETRRKHRVFGDVVVLAASGIESIRILFNSATSRHPDGLANSSGLLGRYFMDQTDVLCFADAPGHDGEWEPDPHQPKDDPYFQPAGGIVIPRYQNIGGQSESYLRGFDFQGTGGRFPVPAGSPSAIGGHSMGEMLARYDNVVRVSRRVKDRWGVPVPFIDISFGANERKMIEAQKVFMREVMETAGCRVNFIASTVGLESRNVWPGWNPLKRQMFRLGIKMAEQRIGPAIHECGGARMGTDPGRSVLNGVNQSWDVPNLFITDAASFVTNGTVGPSLTIMALTARACEFIADQYQTNKLSKPTESVVGSWENDLSAKEES